LTNKERYELAVLEIVQSHQRKTIQDADRLKKQGYGDFSQEVLAGAEMDSGKLTPMVSDLSQDLHLAAKLMSQNHARAVALPPPQAMRHSHERMAQPTPMPSHQVPDSEMPPTTII